MGRKVRILLFGCLPGYAPKRLGEQDTELLGGNSDTGLSIWEGLGYGVSVEDVEAIPKLRTSDFDFAVIGNNLGVGVIKAKIVPPRLRHKFVIVWNDRPGEFEEEYVALGYRNLCTRAELTQKLDQLWGTRRSAREKRMK
jgi:hypothetical protein